MLKIQTVDLHVGGEPCRVVVGGVPEIEGKTMREKQEFIRSRYDYIRTSLMLEPRGHKNMFGAFLLKPCNSEADYGVVFMFGSNFEDMCGHGTICICTMLVDRKMVNVREPETIIKLDTPAGVVRVSVHVKNGKAKYVSLTNVPGFIYKRSLQVPTEYGIVPVDIVYAGNAFLMINAKGLIEIKPENASKLTDLGMSVIKSANNLCEFIHPEQGKLRLATADIYDEDRNVVIFGDGQIDRSACGTGTSARLIMMQESKELSAGESFINHSILNTTLTGTILKEVRVGNIPAYVTAISGVGTVFADSTFYIDSNDTLYKGFTLS